MKVCGLYTAIVTPFDKGGNLDEEGLRRNLSFQKKEGVDGIAALGSTGEASTLTAREKERVIRIAKEQVGDSLVLMVGTGTSATATTIEQTAAAEALGADLALIATPCYNKPTQEGIFRHFHAIAKATALPIVVYNVPGRTGQNIEVETLQRLADLPNVVAVKEASGSILQMMEIIQKVKKTHPHFTVMSGDDALALPLLALGGDGLISVASNLVPFPIKKMISAILEGNLPEASDLHYQLLPLFKALFLETNPIPIKAAMEIKGMAAGPCRLPLCELSPGIGQKLQATLEQLPW